MAWCFAETEETSDDAEPILSEPFAYLRLRREEYPDERLARWAERIGATLERGSDVYAYLKHEEGAGAPRHAERLAAMLPG